MAGRSPPGRPEGGDRSICTAGVEEDPSRDFSPDCGRGVAQNDQRGVMGAEGSGEVGWIDDNDVRSRPQQGEGGSDGVAVGVRLDGDEDRRVRHVAVTHDEGQSRPMAALRPQCGPNPRHCQTA